MKRFSWLILLFSISTFATDIPNGLMRTGEGLAVHNYEIMLSPTYAFEPNGTYLSSELRFQPNEDMGVGFGFGSGEMGYHLGTYGVWHVLPDFPSQPAFAVLGGLYLNRRQGESFFVLRVAPMVSESFRTDWGVVTPYGGFQISPSFRLGRPDNQISLRSSMGTQVGLDMMPGFRTWFEFGLGIHNSVHQIMMGFSYPLNAFQG